MHPVVDLLGPFRRPRRFRFCQFFCGKPALNNIALALSSQQSDAIVELQSDSSLYGRGEFHLSANLDVDDVVVVQVGSWLVDGVLVGDDSTDPTLKYVRVDTIQVVWTPQL
jgi:L-alanine-DL-glutamate epimerase-like enolase superfamily enzyme